MKFKTTQKEIKSNFQYVISIDYCGLGSLLRYDNPIAYTIRGKGGCLGWGSDVYDLGDGVAVVTGYAPFGNVKPDYEVVRKYRDLAEQIRKSLKWNEQEAALKALQQDFLREVIPVEKK